MADKTDKLRFAIKPDMPFKTRMGWIAGLLLAGFAVQLAVSPVLGWLIFLAGCLLGIIRSKGLRPVVARDAEWVTTTIEELEQIEKLSLRVKHWQERTGSFRATSGGGCAMLFMGLMGVFISTFLISQLIDGAPGISILFSRLFIAPLRGGFVASIWAADLLTLFIPIWFAGSLSAWEPPELPRKVRYLLDIHRQYKDQPELEFVPSLYVHKKDERSVPTDARLMIKFKDAPKAFMGVQVQISLNTVQGTKYPYGYCVLLAKKEFGLVPKAEPYLQKGEIGALRKFLSSASDKKELANAQFAGSIAEVEQQPEVDVVVVRQIAAGEGYRTSEEQVLEVVSDALNLAQLVLKA